MTKYVRKIVNGNKGLIWVVHGGESMMGAAIVTWLLVYAHSRDLRINRANTATLLLLLASSFSLCAELSEWCCLY